MSKAEEFIKEYTMGCSNDITPIGNYDHTYQEWLTPEQALAAVEIAREETIDKACEFIDKKVNFYLHHYVGVEHECDMVDTRKFIEDFKNYIKGE